jgi:hypothetical protein
LCRCVGGTEVSASGRARPLKAINAPREIAVAMIGFLSKALRSFAY